MTAITRRVLPVIALVLAGCMPALAQWTRTSGPHGGTLLSAWADSEAITAISVEGRIHRYSNKAWMEMGTTGVGAIRRIVRTGDALIGRSTQGISRSTDGGMTWTTTLPGYAVSPPSANKEICAAGRLDTLYMSNDGGKTWSPALQGFNSGWTISISNDRMLVNNGFMFSLYKLPFDLDTPPRLLDTLVPKMEGPVSFISDALLRNDTIYAATIGAGMQLSTDRGITWTSLDSGIPLDQERPTSIASIRFESDEIWGLSQSGELYRFDGSSWINDSLGEYAYDYVRTGDGIVALALNGPKRWDPHAKDWRDIADGLRGVSTTEMAAVPGGLIVSGSQRLFRTMDDGETWETIAPFGAIKLAAGNDVVYALTAGGYHGYGRVVRSFDSGMTWETIDDRLPRPLAAGAAVDIHADGNEVWISLSETFSFHGQSNWVNGGMIRSTDRGTSWSDISAGLPGDGITYVPVHSFVVDETGMLASTSSGIFRSRGRSGGWTPIGSNGLPVSTTGYVQAAITDLFNGHPIARSSYRLYTTGNSGASWNLLAEVDSAAGEFLSDVSVVVDKLYVLIGKWDGTTNTRRLVRISGDGSIEDITDTLPESTILTRFIAGDRFLFAGSQGQSVWRSPLPAASVDGFDGRLLEMNLW